MRKKILLVGLMLLSTVGFAAKSDDDITNIIGNYYSNGSMSLETKETANNTSSAKSDVREKIIDFAKTKLGSPYVWGATGPNSFDCSGFVGYVYQKTAGLVLPRVS
ncbi:MAG: NlpC/P60 family protein, partial [Leptotrichiaceae bacterium]